MTFLHALISSSYRNINFFYRTPSIMGFIVTACVPFSYASHIMLYTVPATNKKHLTENTCNYYTYVTIHM